MLIDSIKIFLLFNLIDWILSLWYKPKISRNFIACFHANFSVLFNGIYFLTYYDFFSYYSFCVSIGYFLFDMYYIVIYENINLLRAMYLYHHFASIYMILNCNQIPYSHDLIFFGEFSNLPSYVIYHYLHLDNKKKYSEEIKYWKLVQKILYGIIRIGIMSIYLFYMAINLDFSNYHQILVSLAILPIYFMGLAWTFLLIKG